MTNPTADLQPRRSARQQDYQYSGDQLVSDIPDEDVPPVENFMVHSFGPDPDTWREALDSKLANEWIIAREKEKNSFKEHGVLEMVPRETAKGSKARGSTSPRLSSRSRSTLLPHSSPMPPWTPTSTA